MQARTAAPMTVDFQRKGESSLLSMRNGFRIEPALLVRGSSRRIMSMRFRPANIRVINRRAKSSAAIGTAVQTGTALQAHQQERVPAPPPIHILVDARTVLAVKGSLRRADDGAPLPAVRRSGHEADAMGGSGGNTYRSSDTTKAEGRRSPSGTPAWANNIFHPSHPRGY